MAFFLDHYGLSYPGLIFASKKCFTIGVFFRPDHRGLSYSRLIFGSKKCFTVGVFFGPRWIELLGVNFCKPEKDF